MLKMDSRLFLFPFLPYFFLLSLSLRTNRFLHMFKGNVWNKLSTELCSIPWTGSWFTVVVLTLLYTAYKTLWKSWQHWLKFNHLIHELVSIAEIIQVPGWLYWAQNKLTRWSTYHDINYLSRSLVRRFLCKYHSVMSSIWNEKKFMSIVLYQIVRPWSLRVSVILCCVCC